ncbi:MAG: YhbY family RNA-binding protein [Clostridiales bacterium]|nr:YhbY family RNA-binding protein [Clostridiales bacterium]
MTNKGRARLRGLANSLPPFFQIGKAGVTPELTEAVAEALEKRELLKLSVLESCETSPDDVADALCGRTRSEVVQVIGRKIVLYKKSAKHPVIEV